MVITTVALAGASYALDAALEANSQGKEVTKIEALAPSKVRRIVNLVRAAGNYLYRTKTQENPVKLAAEAVTAALDIPLTLSPDFGVPAGIIEARKVFSQVPAFFEDYTEEMRLENTDPGLAKVQAAAQHVVQEMKQEKEPRGLMFYTMMGLAHMEKNGL